MRLPEVTRLPSSRQWQAAELFARNYKDDPSIGSMFGETEEPTLISYLTYYFNILIGLAMKHGEVICVIQDGEVVGASTLYPPGTYPLPFSAMFGAFVKIAFKVIQWGGLFKLVRLCKLVMELEKGHPESSHYYIEIGCVDRKSQKLGVAAALLKSILVKADRARLGCYIETSNKINVSIWGKFGFKVTAERLVDGVTYWSMWREVQAATDTKIWASPETVTAKSPPRLPVELEPRAQL